MYFC
jgi:chromosome segregation ATPase